MSAPLAVELWAVAVPGLGWQWALDGVHQLGRLGVGRRYARRGGGGNAAERQRAH